jgi:hypothetical protein
MTPKDKAWELVIKYRLIEFDKTEDTRLMISIADAKECALIAVDEILEEYKEDYKDIHEDIFTIYSWWKQVKKEIEAL